MTNWKHFLVGYLSVMVMFAGVAGFVGFNEKDTRWEYRGVVETPPRNVDILTYEDLTSREKELVDSALAGEETSHRFDTRAEAPPPVVRIDGTYHKFAVYGVFDWFHHRTFTPVLLAIGGLYGAVTAVRWDIRS